MNPVIEEAVAMVAAHVRRTLELSVELHQERAATALLREQIAARPAGHDRDAALAERDALEAPAG
ncbi:MAG TPA: hypothetical protein VD995_04640 [Azospirillum sp.]|nr:hypothetical protein [Azospirillum sp.]